MLPLSASHEALKRIWDRGRQRGRSRSSLSTLSSAREAWERLWDRGKVKQKSSTSTAKRTETRNTTTATHRRKKRESARNYALRVYKQRTLKKTTLNDAEEFGDIMRRKLENILRVGFHNIANLPEDKRTSKSRQLVTYIVEKAFDVFMVTEVGLCWRKVHSTDQWYERIWGKFRSARSSFANNVTELQRTKVLQTGGTGVIATDDVAHRVTEQGRDPTGLGRWSWIKLQGRNNTKVRVISVYRPCDSDGPATVNQQHYRYLRKHGCDFTPRKAVYEDLFLECTEWMEDGEQLIIGIDANEDVRFGDTAEFFRALGMREAILERHSDLSPPATHNRNTQRQPIDGIWVTPGLRAIAAGYEAFGTGCPSDHRVLWVDFTYEDAFGYDSPPLIAPVARRLNNRDPRLVERYVQRLRKALTTTGLTKRLFKLESAAHRQGWNQAFEKEYNSIQTEQLKIRKEIERDIRKLKTGGIPWSPKLQRYRTAIELWSMILRKRKGIKVSTRRIRRFMRKTGQHDALQANMLETIAKLSHAHAEYKEAKKDARVWRNDFLESLAEAKAKRNGTTKEKELDILRRIERQKAQARNIKRVRKKLGKSAVTKVYATVDGERQECDNKESMEDAFIHENGTRFSQSHSTPPMVEPLLSDLGFLADTEAAEQILSGTYEIPDDLDPYAKLLIKELRTPAIIQASPPLATTISTESHVAGWKRQKEGISADPAGLTFSHYKAGITDDLIAKFDASLRSIPYQHGFTPQAWIPMTDVEILKKAGVYDVEKMRTILLMNSEFNINNKKLGRDMMHNAERCGTLAREQYGSRKNHKSIMAALNKRLTMDVLRQRRQAGALCANDAKSCYDRIVHNVATLAMRRQGVPKAAVKCMFSTLQKAAHKIRTAFGLSKKTYGPDRDPPLQGIGQGNGCGPAGWAVISTPIINLMRTAGYGFRILTALTVTCIAFVCYAFVDDTDVVHTAETVNTSGLEVLYDMQKVVDHWEGGLRATGGALVPDKSYWYLIDHVWTGTKWRYATMEDIPGDIDILDIDGRSRVWLRRFEVDHAEETLGVFLAMDGNNEAEVQKLREKAEEFVECIRTGFLTREDATMALHSTIMKTLEYPLAAINLTEKQWDYIMSPVLMGVLPRMGYNRTFKRDVVYAPKEYCGLGLIHPFYNQHLTHLQVILQEATQPSITGDLLRASLEQLRLEVGCGGDLSECPIKEAAELITECWFKDLLIFMDKHELVLHDPLPQLELYRGNDRYLIKAFINNGYHGKHLARLNVCRQALRVTTLSEIATSDGKYLEQWALKGQPQEPINKYEWPRQPKPTAAYWRDWELAVISCFADLYSAEEYKKLRGNLGPWKASMKKDWNWFYSAIEQRVYHFERLGWRGYTRLSRRSQRVRLQKFVRNEDVLEEELPDDAQMASVERTAVHSIIRLTGIGEVEETDEREAVEHPTTIVDALMQQKEEDQWAVESLDCVDNGISIATAIIKGTARSVSDGSYKEERGTSAFSLHAPGGNTNSITGVNAIPGNDRDQSAYRSELGGVSGTLAIVSSVCKVHDIHEGCVTIGLDGEQALKAAGGEWRLNPSQADFDLLTDIRKKLARLPIQVKWKWIRGHQDDDKTYEELDEWAQANVRMDELAKSFLKHLNRQNFQPEPQRFGDEEWSISFRGKKLSKVDKTSLYSALHRDKILDYWAKRSDLSRENIDACDWEVCGKAFKSISLSKQRRLTKHASGLLASGKMMKIWKFQDHSECPRCPERLEDAIHILNCPAPSATLTWNTALDNLAAWMTKSHTLPEMQTVIIARLRQWHIGNECFNFDLPELYGLSEATFAQDEIGWYNFLMGRVSIRWRDVQQQYFQSLGKRNTGKRWVQSLITKSWEVSWNMWEHRNGIKHNTLTPAKLREIEIMNIRVDHEFQTGTRDLGIRDHHWFSKPKTVIQQYEYTLKAQWLASVELARERYANRHELATASVRHQRRFLSNWLGVTEPEPALLETRDEDGEEA